MKKLCSQNRTSKDYVDPGVGSIMDGYPPEKKPEIADYYFGQKKQVCDALRDRMVFLCNHAMILRGEVFRDITLNYMFSMEFHDEGATYCPALVLMVTFGKQNQEHEKEYSGLIRHKDPKCCGFGAVGFYLFYRFQVLGKDFPEFSRNENWFDTELSKGQKPKKGVSYHTQLKSISKALNAVDIKNSKKKTHSGRQAGAREAEQAGLDLSNIRRAGGWLGGSLEKNYLDGLPRKVVRVLGGFPKEQGCFWLPHILVEPPQVLKEKVFPKVEYWQKRMNEDDTVHTISGEGFLKLLVELRTIILQDTVIMRQYFPHHEMFTHEIFMSPEFNSFASTLINPMSTTIPPPEIEIQRVVPQINSRIDELRSQINQVSRANSLNQKNENSNQALLVEKMDHLISLLSINTSSDIPLIRQREEETNAVTQHRK